MHFRSEINFEYYFASPLISRDCNQCKKHKNKKKTWENIEELKRDENYPCKYEANAIKRLKLLCVDYFQCRVHKEIQIFFIFTRAQINDRKSM
jgi:hypothetical protein